LPDDARQDPTWTRSGRLDPGRDGCRVPLPWTTQVPNYGFSGGRAAFAPWLPQPDWFAKYAVSEQLQDATSTLSLHRQALLMRRGLFPASEATGQSITWVDIPGRDDALAFRRGDVTCVVVFGDEPLPLPEEWGEVL